MVTLLGGKGGLAVDPALDAEQRVDPRHRFQRHRRDRRNPLAASLADRDVSELEARPPSIAPAQRLNNRPRQTPRLVDLPVTGIGFGLKNAGKTAKMLDRMIAEALPRVTELRRRRVHAAPNGLSSRTQTQTRPVSVLPMASTGTGVFAVQPLRRRKMGRDPDTPIVT